MTKKTEYKTSIGGSIGAGMKSVFGGNGRKYFILEHKVSTLYHKAGETQKIIVDEIELGRDPKCAVRFDDSFETVSRRHAAIVKDGDNWKLVQLSKTNSTYLNGHKVETEWFLQSGDEIQLSTNGPKLGFIVPQGDQASVKSIGLTARLSLFRQQALRPYKTALSVLSSVLVLVVAGSVWFGIDTKREMVEQRKQYASDLHKRDSVDFVKDSIQREQFAAQNAKHARELDSVSRVYRSRLPVNVSTLIDQVESSVYFLEGIIYDNSDGERIRIARYTGTGFLLDDGRFVTARHCASWRYNPNLSMLVTMYGMILEIEITATNMNGDVLRFRDSDFTRDESKDRTYTMDQVDENNNRIRFICAYPQKGEKDMWATDWAYVQTDKRGKIKANGQLSVSLNKGEQLHVLGFPKGLGVSESGINPVYNSMTTSLSGLDDNNCIMISLGTDHGNSGGPVFAVRNNQLYAIGIVSRGDDRSELYDHLVPIKNIY